MKTWIEVPTPVNKLYYKLFFRYWQWKEGKVTWHARTPRFRPWIKPYSEYRQLRAEWQDAGIQKPTSK